MKTHTAQFATTIFTHLIPALALTGCMSGQAGSPDVVSARSTDPKINFEGFVFYKDTRQPTEGVSVRLVDLDREAIADKNGAFCFADLPPGLHTVELSAKHLVTTINQEIIAQADKRAVKYAVEAKDPDVDEESLVRAPRIKQVAVPAQSVTSRLMAAF